MVQISKRKLDPRLMDKLFDLFFEIVGNKTNKKIFDNVIKDLLSPTERIMVAKRIAIVYLLLKKKDQRSIGQVLKVSVATVNKFSLLIERSEGIVPSFRKLLRNDKISLFINELFEVLFPPGTYRTNWKTGWERRKAIRREKTLGI